MAKISTGPLGRTTQYWLMKSEPEVFSIEDLKAKKKSLWDGVRNYAARNFMQAMKVGDQVLFYHSSCEPPGVAGLAEVTHTAQPDPSQFDKKSEYFEPKATKAKPLWFCTEVGFEEKFKNLVSLPELKTQKKLANMVLFKQGRLSVQPVTKEEFEWICNLGRR